MISFVGNSADVHGALAGVGSGVMSRIKNAIIIHGPGRSGTTLFNNVLSLHPELAWISGYVNRFPGWPFLSILNRLQSIRKFEEVSRGKRYLPRPAEAYRFWDYYAGAVRIYDEQKIKSAPNFDDLTRALSRIMHYQGRPRLIIKLTGLARGAFIEKVFENPLILYIDRDPRDIIVSYFRQRWLYKGKPNFDKIDRSQLINEYVALFNSFEASKTELKAFDFRQLRYEDLVDNPVDFFRKIIAWAGLTHDDRFYKTVQNWRIGKEGLGRWQSFFSSDEVKQLNVLLERPLRTLGYPVA